MKDKSILMTPANREAIVEDRKTMTRRLCKVQPESTEMCPVIVIQDVNSPSGYSFYSDMISEIHLKAPCAIGQRLYIKEPHYRYGKWLKNGLTKKTERQAWKFKSYGDQVHGPELFDFPDTERGLTIHPSCDTYRDWSWYKRSPLFMPREFARTWLLVTDVKAPERIQDISEPDAVAEGIDAEGCCRCPDEIAEGVRFCLHCNLSLHDLISEFKILWNSIHGEGSWDANPWVWPIEFGKIE